MWTEKYRPESLDEYRGNRDNVEITMNWMNSVLRGSPIGEGLLYYGPPGTGKTTLALLLEEVYDLPLKYCNASDKRKKKDVQELLTAGMTRPLGKKKTVLIMDEVESVSTSLDKLIEHTHPIFICNDMYELSKSVRNSLIQLEFEYPSKQEKKGYADMIVEKESINLDKSHSVYDELLESSRSYRSVAQNLLLLKHGYTDFSSEKYDLGLYEEIEAHFQGERVMNADVKPRELLVWAMDNGGHPGLISALDRMLGRTPRNDYRAWKYVYSLAGMLGAEGTEYPRQFKLMSKYG